MSQERLFMRKIHLILRLDAEGLSGRQISLSVGVARSTVSECLRRASAAGIGWPPPTGLDETAIERRLYPPLAMRQVHRAGEKVFVDYSGQTGIAGVDSDVAGCCHNLTTADVDVAATPRSAARVPRRR